MKRAITLLTFKNDMNDGSSRYLFFKRVQGGYSTNEVRWSTRVLCRTFIIVVFHGQAYSDTHCQRTEK